MSSKTVQRSRLLMEDLGFAVTIVEGRYLTLVERRAARETHGGRQIKAASLRALTLPRPSRPVENVHLPSVETFNPSSLVKKNSPKRADARRTVAPLPQPKKKRKEQRQIPGSAHAPERPRPLNVQKLAAALARRVRWLDTGQHLGALCRVLESVGVDGDQWTAGDVIEAMDRVVQQRHMSYPDRARNPLGFVRWALSLAIEPATTTPAQERARIDAERRERIARQAQKREAERLRVAAIDREEVARIIAASNAEIAAMNRERRTRKLS